MVIIVNSMGNVNIFIIRVIEFLKFEGIILENIVLLLIFRGEEIYFNY